MKKYETIARSIEQQIRSGKWAAGERLPSIRQIAMRCKCSTYPVVQAMQKLEKRGRVLHVEGRGYLVSRENRRRIMLISTAKEGAIERYYDSFKEEAAKAQVRFQILVVPERSAWRGAVSEVRRWAPDAVLLDVEGLVIPFHCVRTLLKTVPVIFCNRFEWPDISTEGLCGVLFDQHRLLALQFRYLREHNCRRIRYVPTQDELQPFLKKHLEELAAENDLLWGEDSFAVAGALHYFSPRWRDRVSRELPDGLMGNDVSIFKFQQILETVFGPHPEIVKIGASDSIWSRIAGHEFDSFHTPWHRIWRRALSGEVNAVEYIQPELRHHSRKTPAPIGIAAMECRPEGDAMHFRWTAQTGNAFYLLYLSRTTDFSQARVAGTAEEPHCKIPLSAAAEYSFWRVAAVTPEGGSACSEIRTIKTPAGC